MKESNLNTSKNKLAKYECPQCQLYSLECGNQIIATSPGNSTTTDVELSGDGFTFDDYEDGGIL